MEPFAARTLDLVAAQALGRLGRIGEAEQRVAAVASEAPDDIRPAATRIALRMDDGQTGAAEELLREALDAFAGNAR